MENIPKYKAGQRTIRKSLSAGVERVLYLAAGDEAFRQALFDDRVDAVLQRGIKLTASERAMLQNIPRAQLRRSIAGMDLSEDNLRRRSFLRAVAVSAAALAVGQPVGDCASSARADANVPEDGGPPDVKVDVPPFNIQDGVLPPPPDLKPDVLGDVQVDVPPFNVQDGARPSPTVDRPMAIEPEDEGGCNG